jgi:hypothetical protein
VRSFAIGLVMILATAAYAGTAEEDALAHLNDGVAHYNRNELDAARTDFIAARDLFPERANPHRWLGLTEARLGHCDAAVVELEQFLQSVPPRDPRVPEAIAVRDLCRKPAQAPVVAPVVVPAPVVVAAPPPPRPKRRYWIAGAVIGGVAVIGLAVGLGVGLTRPSEPHAYPPVSAPPP